MSEPEESYEKTSKTDDVLLKPVLKDLESLKEGEDLDERDRPRSRSRKQEENTEGR
ncbi:hypothetical protein O7635_26255 [Asanoa sp. WMMD1127]|uniref:hypothetical protein n=1 Tax=Asanoa sp. WMMD1127 TaxID=3016107 RepID=UPI002416BD2F|nr:hypothetical protein [Asanoa sp. WMMD1127]MDG4825364.1 hypothetical protein [Asanoa sp. WMMD1127]